VHSVVTTAANVAQSRVLPKPLHGDAHNVWEDGGNQRQTKAIQQAAPKAQDMPCKRTKYKNRVEELKWAKKRNKASVRAKAESLPHREVQLRLRQGALPRASQEVLPVVRLLCAHQPQLHRNSLLELAQSYA
jgi:hypothetical protein